MTGASISASLERSCVPAGGVLPPGRGLECGVAFEVGAGFEPASITFSVDELSASSPVPPLGGPVPDAGPVDAGPLSPSNELDILFLVDDSSSMSEPSAEPSATTMATASPTCRTRSSASGRRDCSRE